MYIIETKIKVKQMLYAYTPLTVHFTVVVDGGTINVDNYYHVDCSCIYVVRGGGGGCR